MDERKSGGRSRLNAWFEEPLGVSLRALEAHRLREILPALAGTFAVQIGHTGGRDLLESSPTAVHVVIDPEVDTVHTSLRATAEALPFDARSIQVMVLPHTLDVSHEPHQVLREVHRVLAPEGSIIILGFNPVSLWNLWCLSRRACRTRPWCCGAIGLSRIKDWLALLDFELTHGSMLYYRPPVTRPSCMDRLFFLEKIGDRWWPLGAAVYLVVARKRTPGLTPIPSSLRRRRLRAVSQPAGIRHG